MLTTVHASAIVDTGKKYYATGKFICKSEYMSSYIKNIGAIKQTCKLVWQSAQENTQMVS